MKIIKSLLIIHGIVLLDAVNGCPFNTNIFVNRSSGDDRNNGTVADFPLETLAASQRAAVRIRKFAGENIVVCISGGSYFLEETLHLTIADSGISFVGQRSESGEEALVSAGIPVTGWGTHPLTKELLVAKIPESFNATMTGMEFGFYVNGGERQRARLPIAPNKYFEFESPLVPCANPSAWSPSCPNVDQQGFVFKRGDINPMYDISSVRVSAPFAFTRGLYKIRSVFQANSTILFSNPQPGNQFGMYPGPSGSRFSLENTREGLAPGRWYYDRPNRRLEYWPLPGETPSNIDAIVSHLGSALVIDGTSSISIRNLTFAHSTGQTLLFKSSREIILKDSKVKHSMEHAIQITNCKGVWVHQCVIEDTGLTGILVDGAIDTNADLNRDILVSDSQISWTGRAPNAGQTFGIRLGGSSNISAIHNEVSFSTYGGIGVGWQWGPPASTFTWPIFRVGYNKIHSYGEELLSDFGGVYTSGLCSGTEDLHDDKCMVNVLVEQNVVYNGTCFNYGCTGLYSDFSGGAVTFRKNLVYDVGDEGISLHCGYYNVASNNIVAAATSCNSKTCAPHSYLYGCEYGHPTSGTFEKNVLWIEKNTSSIFVGYAINAPSDNVTFSKNVYFSPQSTLATKRLFPHVAANATDFTFSEWQKTGQDAGSTCDIDPGFINPSPGVRDFRFRHDSPLFAMGIHEIDTIGVGPRL